MRAENHTREADVDFSREVQVGTHASSSYTWDMFLFVTETSSYTRILSERA